MTKEDYIKEFLSPRILLGAFNKNEFIHRDDINIIEKEENLANFKDYYCPWFHKNGELVLTYEEAKDDKDVRAMKVSDKDLIDLYRDKTHTIAQYQNNPCYNLLKFPLARDLDTGRILILDSNKTSVALYRNYLDCKINDIKIPVVEISGENLKEVIGDFYIVNR